MRFALTLLFLVACSASPSFEWAPTHVHDTSCPDGADERACAVVDLNYPVFNGSLADSLNALMLNTLCLTIFDDVPCPDVASIAEKFIDEFKTFQHDFPEVPAGWELSQHINIVNETPKVLALAHEFYVFTGGAHGMPGHYFINIDKNTGNVLALADILKKDKHAELLKMGKQIFYQQRDIPAHQSLADAGYWFEDDKFSLPDNFSIAEHGLLFLYNPYEIASYADGMIEVFIPYADIKSLLKMERIK